MRNLYKNLGYGIGLRPAYYQEIIDLKPPLDWLEIISEDYFVPGGRSLFYLDQIRQHYPIVMHGVSLSIGSTDPLNYDYLQQVKNLAKRIEPEWISDHLCWTGVQGLNLHDLMPLPYTEEAIQHVVERILRVQDYLGQQILLENVSSYVNYKHSTLSEWEFISEVVERADCLILLDLNNIYVSAFNHQFDPLIYLQNIPHNRVQQFHLAGHQKFSTHIIDTHDLPIVEDVWSLYRQASSILGPVATLIERDDNIPVLTELLTELNQARSIANEVLSDETKRAEWQKS